MCALVLSLIPTRASAPEGPRDRRIHLSSNGVHTDFILPREFVDPALREQLGPLADYPHLAFGWGDKGFYLDTPTWAQLKASTAVRAMLLPSPTAMHVTGYRGVGRDWATLDLSREQLVTLNTYLREGFRRGTDGRLQPIDAPGYGPDDTFYEAVGSYNAIYTCNSWINEGLKKMGVRTAVWAPSEWGIMRWRQSGG
ncbi:TIGR02117 family protein [Lewinella sp. IMCC34183]|uniref:TIGR02117 family protein n=1 Tax=Lewinella sp. IMCC34183 TaxID=2248762 RepID=UPI0021084C33|nr:TIGR02117 family protein [Lewinella sp. IMCC34183]